MSKKPDEVEEFLEWTNEDADQMYGRIFSRMLIIVLIFFAIFGWVMIARYW